MIMKCKNYFLAFVERPSKKINLQRVIMARAFDSVK